MVTTVAAKSYSSYKHTTRELRIEVQQLKDQNKKSKETDQKEIKDLKAKVEDKAAQKAVEAAQAMPAPVVATYAPPVVTTPPAAPNGLSDAQMEQYIFDNEGQLASINPGGCIGLGQSCPAIRGDSAHAPLALACPDWATNRPCQLNFWQNYMLTHINIDTGKPYGTWAVAYQFKMRHGWW